MTGSRVIAVLAVLLLAAICPAQAGETLDRVEKDKVLRISTDPSYPPQSFLDENNQIIGFDVDVGREIATRLGVGMVIVTPSWEIVTSGRWNRRWDLAVGSITATKDRRKVLNFPAVYYRVPASFAVHERSKVRRIEELSGRIIGVCGGCTYEAYLRGRLNLTDSDGPLVPLVKPREIRTYETDLNALDDLKLGDGVRIEAVLSSLPILRHVMENGYPLRIVGQPVFSETLAVATAKGDTEFDDRISTIVQAMKSDGALAALSKKWYGTDLSQDK